MDRNFNYNQRPRPDTVFSNDSVDSVYLQSNDDPGRQNSVYNLPAHADSTATLVTPPSNPTSQPPNSHHQIGASHILARNNGARGHRRQNSSISLTSTSTNETLPPYSSQENLIHQTASDESHQANVDRNLSIYSLYRRDSRSHQSSYLPRVPLQPNIGQGIGVRQTHHRRQTSDFSVMSNGSETTLVQHHSNDSSVDLDLERGTRNHGKSKLWLSLSQDSDSTVDLYQGKELPAPPPVTPAPKRVLKRTGVCCGLCCFATLALACMCAVSFMMLAVNANLDGWGHRNVVHMPLGLKSPRLSAPPDVGGEGNAKMKPTSVVFNVLPSVSATKS